MRIGLVVVMLVGAACARALPGQDPPENGFYYPISLTLSPDQRFAYVVSSNFDLRYNAGWVSALDLDAVLLALDGAPASNGCANSDACASGQACVAGKCVQLFVGSGSNSRLKVPSLGGDLALSPDGTFAVLPSRGQPTVTWIDISGGNLSCAGGDTLSGLDDNEERTDCGRRHMLRLDSDVDYGVPLTSSQTIDPYAAAVFANGSDTGAPCVTNDQCQSNDCTSGGTCAARTFAAIGHLMADLLFGGQISLLSTDSWRCRMAERGSCGRAAWSIPIGGVNGIGRLAVYPDGTGRLFAGGGQSVGQGSPNSVMYSFAVDLALADENAATRESINATAGGTELLGITFSPDGRLAFVANNRNPGTTAGPDSIVVLDARLQPLEHQKDDGTYVTQYWPRYDVLGGATVEGRPSHLAYIERPGADWLAVTSFDDDAIFLFAPQDAALRDAGQPLSGALQPLARIERLGGELLADRQDGPFAAAHARRCGYDAADTSKCRDLLLVTSFFGHGLMIFDMSVSQPDQVSAVVSIASQPGEQ